MIPILTITVYGTSFANKNLVEKKESKKLQYDSQQIMTYMYVERGKETLVISHLVHILLIIIRGKRRIINNTYFYALSFLKNQ